MGGEVFISPSPSGGGGGSRSKRNSNNSLTLAVFLSAVLFTLVVILVDQCEGQQLHPEHRGDLDGGVNLNDYEDDDGGVVPILNRRSGIQHEDVLTAVPNHYYVPNSGQFQGSPVYQSSKNGSESIGSAASTSATPEAGTTSAAVGKDGKDFTPPNDIVRGFKPVYPDDARFVSITTSTVGPSPKRRKKVKRVKGQNAQQQQQQQQQPGSPQGQFQQQQPQQGFQNSFGFQPTGPGGYFQSHPFGHGGSSGPYFAAANHYYSFTAGNGVEGQNNGNYSGHVAFPNDTSAANASQLPPGYSTLYSTNSGAAGSQQQQQGQDQYQQQAGPYLSSGVPLTGAPGFPQQLGPHGMPHGPPHGPPKMNPLKKLANFIRGRPRPPPPMGYPPLPPHGPPLQGIPPYQQGQNGPLGAANNQQQVGLPPQYLGGPQGHYPGQGQQQRHPPYNPALLQQQQQQQQQLYLQQQQQLQQQQAQAQQQNQTQSQQNSNSTNNPVAAASSNTPVGYPATGNIPGYPGALQPGQLPHGPPRPGGPNKNFLSKLNFNSYLKKFSNMFQRGPPPPGQPLGIPPPGGKAPPNGANGQIAPHGPPPQQKVPQQMLYPHYYPMNTYAPNGPNAQAQAQYQQQLQQQQQPGVTPGNNQIRRRRIKVRKNGMDPRNRKVDDAPEALDQKELIGRPRLAGQTDDVGSDDDMDMPHGINDPIPHEMDENAGGRRRKRLATISSIATSSTSSSSSSSSSDSSGHASSGYRMPGIFGMDSGKAFYLDKDPQTGDITFNPPSSLSTSGENSPPGQGGSASPSSNELSPDSKYKPIIIHSYSSTKNQGGLSTYKRPNLSTLNNKFKAKRPTFYKFNKTSTLAPPRLPSFYVPSTTQFPTTTTTATTPSAILPGSEEGSSAKTEFPNVIVAKSSSEVVTRVSMSSSVTSSKEVSGPQYKKKSPVKFPLFKHTTPSTTTSTSSTTTEEVITSTAAATTSAEEQITTTAATSAPLKVETSTASTTTTTTSTTTEPTSTTLFFDPYLPIELLNLQRQAIATASTTSTTPTPPSTTTEELTTTSTTTTTEEPSTTTTVTTTVDPYTVPEIVKVETTAQTTTTATPSTDGSSSSVLPSAAPSETSVNTNGSSLLPTGPEAEQADQSQELDEDEDYYYDNPEPGQGYGAPGAAVAPGQFNSFGQFRPGAGMPPHGMPGGYYNPMMGGGHQGRPPVVPPHPNNYYNSFNPFGPPGYYPGPPNQPQNAQGGGFFNPDFVPSHGVPISTEASTVQEVSTAAETTPTASSTTTSSTTPSTTTTSSTTTTTESPTTTVASTTTEATTLSTSETTTTSTTVPPQPSPPQQEADIVGETDVYEEYEDEPEGDTAVLPSQQKPQQQPPNSFHLPPPSPQRPQPPIPPHRRPPPPPFMNRLPPMYFNNQRPPPVRPGQPNFPFRPPPPVKEVIKNVVTSSEVPPTTSTTIATTTSTLPTTTTTTTTRTTPPPPPTTTPTTTTTTEPSTTTTTTTTENVLPPLTSHSSREDHSPSESREAVNQDLFIPPEQLLAYTPSPDRVQDELPDEVIQDIAPGFDLFNVQWGQKVPPPSSTSYSSQEQQPVPYQTQYLTTTSTTLAPPTTRIISRNVTEVNINGTDYIYEYIDEIIEEEVPVNASQATPTAAAPSDALQPQPQVPGGVPPQQFYNPYLMNPYNGYVPVSSTPGPYGSQGPYLMPNGQPAWIQPQQPAYLNDYYLPPGVAPNQFPVQGLDGSQQFIPVGAGFNPSSIAPPQELSTASVSSAAAPSPTPEAIANSPSEESAINALPNSHEILTASPSSVIPPLIHITENSVDNAISPSAGTPAPVKIAQHSVAEEGDLSESYIVSLIDPSKQNGTAVSPLGGIGGFISSSTERLPLYQSGAADTVEHTNLLISSTSGTPAPATIEQEPVRISSSTTVPPAPSTSTDKAASYEYVDYPEGDEVGTLSAPQSPTGANAGTADQQQIQNIKALQMMRPPPPLPPHLQQLQQQQQQQQQQQGPPHGPPHHLKKKPSSFLQNLFGKLRPGSGQQGPAPPGGPPHGHGPYPPQNLPPHAQLNKNSYLGDNIPAGSGPMGVQAHGGPGIPLLPPVMVPTDVDSEQFNMDTLFGARNGTVAEDPPASTQVITKATTPSTTTAAPTSAELGSDEEDEVIYVTPEELAKLKETGQVDDFELVEDEEEYEYEDEPLNDITDNKLARSDTKVLSNLGQNETSNIPSSSLLKKTAPISYASPTTEATTLPSSTTTTPPPPTTSAPSLAPVEPVERKQELHSGPPEPYAYTQQLGPNPHGAAPFPVTHGMFQMKPPQELGRPPQVPPHSAAGQHHSHIPPPPPHHHLHHQGRIPVPPPAPYRTIPPSQAAMTPFHHRQSAPSSSVGGSHYNANVGHVAPPPSHFYNPMNSASSPVAISAPSPMPVIGTPIAEKRQDTFNPKYDYDDSLEIITAGPMLDPSVPRDIIVKSSFNTANGAGGPKPKSLTGPSSSPGSSSSSLSGLWQGAVEKVSTFIGDVSSSSSNSGSSYLQKQSSHQPFSNFGRALPNHYDKNAHLRLMQASSAAVAEPNHHQSSSSLLTRGMRHMHESDSSSSSNSKINSSRNYWGPGI